MTHRHRAEKSTDRPFAGPVARRQTVAAHGNITRIEVCACGAQRSVAINGVHRERGEWLDPQPGPAPKYAGGSRVVSVRLPRGLVDELDDEAARSGTARSDVIVERLQR